MSQTEQIMESENTVVLKSEEEMSIETESEKETQVSTELQTHVPETEISTLEMYATDTLNIRSNASIEGEIVGTFSAGDIVTVEKIEGEWAVISYNNEMAYVSSQYLSHTRPDYVKKVWICNTGAKYHIESSCSNMNNPYQVTIEEAQAMGYEACKKCY